MNDAVWIDYGQDDDPQSAAPSPINVLGPLGFSPKGRNRRVSSNQQPDWHSENLDMNWRMPFRKKARIVVTNENPDRSTGLYWQVDWVQLEDLPPETPYFYARYRQEYPAVEGSDYLLADLTGSLGNCDESEDGFFFERPDFFSSVAYWYQTAEPKTAFPPLPSWHERRVHWQPLNEHLEEAFTRYEQWGIAGLMVDFLDRDDQEMVQFCERVLESAARHRLHIQFHGFYKPSGEQRTYPNLMNREGVLNLEYLKWSAQCTPQHNVDVAYTRALAGPTDYPLGGFRSVSPSQFKPQNVTPPSSARGATTWQCMLSTRIPCRWSVTARRPTRDKRASSFWRRSPRPGTKRGS